MKLIKTSSSLTISAAMLGACAMLAFTPSSAFADDGAAPRSFAFDFGYSLSELQTEEAADKMLKRLQNAVTRECLGPDRATPAKLRMAQACVDATMQDTVGKIGSRALADAYETRSAG